MASIPRKRNPTKSEAPTICDINFLTRAIAAVLPDDTTYLLERLWRLEEEAMKGIRLGPSVVLVAAAIAGCAKAPGAHAGDAPAKLDGTQWRPIVLQSAPVEDSGRAMLRFAEAGTLQANDGCNVMGGSWSAKGSELSIALGPSTLMACPPPIDVVAQSLRSALASTQSFALDGGRLSLLGASGEVVAVLAPTEPASLAGSSWVVRSVNNGRQAVVGVPAGVTITARFGTDGKVSGSAGCNDYNGTYTTDGTSLSFSPLRTTRKACSPEIMAEESRFLAALAHVARHQLGQRELDLFDAGGARMATLVSQP
jgi:heat shock protein HslJ